MILLNVPVATWKAREAKCGVRDRSARVVPEATGRGPQVEAERASKAEDLAAVSRDGDSL